MGSCAGLRLQGTNYFFKKRFQQFDYCVRELTKVVSILFKKDEAKL
jgi:hypothetical protein